MTDTPNKRDDARRVANRIRDAYTLAEAERILRGWHEQEIAEARLQAQIELIDRMDYDPQTDDVMIGHRNYVSHGVYLYEELARLRIKAPIGETNGKE